MKIKDFGSVRQAALAVLCAVLLAVFSAPSGAQPAVTPGDEEPYTVLAGDTVIGIARRLLEDGETRQMQRALARHNALDDADEIRPGQVLRIPRAWLRSRPATLEVAEHQGRVTSGGQPVRSGQPLGRGADLETGRDGYVTIVLADGSSLTLMPSSAARIERAEHAPSRGHSDTAIRLEQGRAETILKRPAAGASRFEIRTPVAVAAVRGTRFRVASDAARSGSTSEVLQGEVGVSDTKQQASVGVRAGFGTRVAAGGAPLAPRLLLPAPYLWTGTRLIESRRTEVNFNPLREAVGYRVVVSSREDFRTVLSEMVIDRAVFPIEGLADGTYFLRVRGIDDIGLEGLDSDARLLVRLRPDAPRTTAPPAGGKVYGARVELRWERDPAAQSYLLQFAADPLFREGLQSFEGLTAPSHAVTGVRPGRYYWRVASVRADQARSLFSDAVLVETRPLPVPPDVPTVEAETLALTWSGAPGQRFELELSDDAGFARIVGRLRSSDRIGRLPRPAPGTYFLRLRATDADGSVSPYTPGVEFRVPLKAARPPCLAMGPGGVCASYGPRPDSPPAR